MSRDQLQQKEMESLKGMAADVDVDAEHRPETSRKASNAGLRREAVQRRGGGDATQDASAVQDAAARGTQAGGSQLPHMDQIQRSFGRHDISHIQAHVGGQAAEASQAMGAEAYASGDHVAFAAQPDLHTAAHEAAHVVQQAQGVNLYGGVGQAGDAYERSADAVADRVVKGESAEDMLGPTSQNKAAPAQAVQRKELTADEQKKADHDTAEQGSYDALRSTLMLAAAKIRASAKAIDKARSTNYGDAGVEPAFDIISHEFENATSAAKHVAGVARKYDDRTLINDKTRVSHIGEEFRAVWGAYRVFKDSMDHANNFADAQKHPLNKNPEWVRLELESLNDRFGKQYQDAFKDSNFRSGEGGGDVKTVANQALTDHLSGALDAAKEIESGTSMGIGRMRTHLNEAKEIVKDVDKSALKKHKPEIQKVVTELTKLKKEQPVFKATWEEFEPLIHDLQKILK